MMHAWCAFAALAAAVEAEDVVVCAPRLKPTCRRISLLSGQEVEQVKECLLKGCTWTREKGNPRISSFVKQDFPFSRDGKLTMRWPGALASCLSSSSCICLQR